jgi:hypothetical protein
VNVKWKKERTAEDDEEEERTQIKSKIPCLFTIHTFLEPPPSSDER